MAKQVINIGAAPDDNTGDTIRSSFNKVNQNFTELYQHDITYEELLLAVDPIMGQLPAPTNIVITPNAVGANPYSAFYRVYAVDDDSGVCSLLTNEIEVIQGESTTEISISLTPTGQWAYEYFRMMVRYSDGDPNIYTEWVDTFDYQEGGPIIRNLEFEFSSMNPPMTYAEVVAYIEDNSGFAEVITGYISSLVPGAKYRMPFQTRHFITSGLLDPAYYDEETGHYSYAECRGELEHLILTATSEHSIDVVVSSEEYPQDILHYDWDQSKYIGNAQLSYPDPEIERYNIIEEYQGVITYREDTAQMNKCSFDFRNVLSRYWSIFQPEWEQKTYSQFEVVQYNNCLYMAEEPGAEWNHQPDQFPLIWKFLVNMVNTGWCISPYRGSISILDCDINIVDQNDYQDYLTFGYTEDYPYKMHNSIIPLVNIDGVAILFPKNIISGQYSNQNIIEGESYSNIISYDCYTNHITDSSNSLLVFANRNDINRSSGNIITYTADCTLNQSDYNALENCYHSTLVRSNDNVIRGDDNSCEHNTLQDSDRNIIVNSTYNDLNSCENLSITDSHGNDFFDVYESGISNSNTNNISHSYGLDIIAGSANNTIEYCGFIDMNNSDNNTVTNTDLSSLTDSICNTLDYCEEITIHIGEWNKASYCELCTISESGNNTLKDTYDTTIEGNGGNIVTGSSEIRIFNAPGNELKACNNIVLRYCCYMYIKDGVSGKDDEGADTGADFSLETEPGYSSTLLTKEIQLGFAVGEGYITCIGFVADMESEGIVQIYDNLLTEWNLRPPHLIHAYINAVGSSVSLEFDGEIMGYADGMLEIIITVNGTTPLAVTNMSFEGRFVTLTLDGIIYYGDTATIDFAEGTIKATWGEFMAPDDFGVDNLIPAPAPELDINYAGPTGAIFQFDNPFTRVICYFDIPLDTETLSISDFLVKINGDIQNIQQYYWMEQTNPYSVRLEMIRTILSSDEVLVSIASGRIKSVDGALFAGCTDVLCQWD